MMQDALKKVIDGRDLSESEMTEAMNHIMAGEATEAQIAAFIIALKIKGETVQEITGAAKSMRANATPIVVKDPGTTVEIVGTGGDGSNTFNISTASCIVASAAGLKIAKHGNRAVSSSSGAADVLEALGINLDIPPEQVSRCIEETGIGFLFAPKLHPAMKHAARPRKEIGVRTIFNILGPLTNPADAAIQVLGVFDQALTDVMAHVLKELGRKRAMVVHGKDGLDEITLGGETVVSELKNGSVSNYTIHPQTFGLTVAPAEALAGGTPEDNAVIITDIFKGKKGPHRDVVCLNVAAALSTADAAADIPEGLKMATEAIDSGGALQKLEAFKTFTQSL